MLLPSPHPAYQLARKVLDATDGHPLFNLMPKGWVWTDEDVGRLIRLSYDASLMAEEGRYPNVRLVSDNSVPPVCFGNNVPWDSIPLSDPDALRRLAPIATRPSSALAVGVANGIIRCFGVHEYAHVISPPDASWSNRWEPVFLLGKQLLTVRIEGPGQVRAAFLPAQSFLLRGGEITPVRSWADINEVRTVIELAGSRLYALLQEIDRPLRPKLLEHPRQCRDLVTLLWSHLLTVTTAAKHGGAYVVAVDNPGDAVHGGYYVNFDLGRRFADVVDLSLQCSGNNFQYFRHVWEGRRKQLCDSVDQLAGLSAVDGCVVLDGQLRVTRFGAKLRSKRSQILPEELKGAGRRHGSAYEFCAEHKAVAFVASQDGHLTIISSLNDATPSVFRNVDPSVGW